jgi:hypothetical protein
MKMGWIGSGGSFSSLFFFLHSSMYLVVKYKTKSIIALCYSKYSMCSFHGTATHRAEEAAVGEMKQKKKKVTHPKGRCTL